MTAVVDHTRIERILRNLVVNATEHGEGKPIDINVVGDDTAVAVRVRDHGIGMSEEVAEHVFDRFYREDKSHNCKKEGYGIGLSMAEGIVRMYKGQIRALWRDKVMYFIVQLPS